MTKKNKLHDFTSHKIINLQQLRQIVKEEPNIATTNGCFDLLHYGHIYGLEQAAYYGNKLIVFVNSDKSIKKLKGKKRPVQPQDIRMKQIASLRCVDYVVLQEDVTPIKLLNIVKPQAHCKGMDYNIEDLLEYPVCIDNNTSVFFLDSYPDLSTTKLIDKIKKL